MAFIQYLLALSVEKDFPILPALSNLNVLGIHNTWFLHYKQSHLDNLFKHRLLGPTKASLLVNLEWGLKICPPNLFPGDVKVLVLRPYSVKHWFRMIVNNF